MKAVVKAKPEGGDGLLFVFNFDTWLFGLGAGVSEKGNRMWFSGRRG